MVCLPCENAHMEWDDLRYVLALKRNPTLAGAAADLGVAHTTVGRRLRAAEKALDVRLFDRTPEGLVATPAGCDLAEVAEAMERDIMAAHVLYKDGFKDIRAEGRRQPVSQKRIDSLYQVAFEYWKTAYAEAPAADGKRADLCLWSPAFFGVKPEMVLIGGSLACAQMGDPNASIPTPQPVYTRPMFGAYGKAVEDSAVVFVSKASMGIGDALGLGKETLPVENCRGIGKADMVLNDAMPHVEVNPETYEVRADGELLTCEPASELPLAQRYLLF